MMKKISLILLVFIANFALFSCTAEDLAEVTNTPTATEGDREHIDPEEEPPGGGE